MSEYLREILKLDLEEQFTKVMEYLENIVEQLNLPNKKYKFKKANIKKEISYFKFKLIRIKMSALSDDDKLILFKSIIAQIILYLVEGGVIYGAEQR